MQINTSSRNGGEKRKHYTIVTCLRQAQQHTQAQHTLRNPPAWETAPPEMKPLFLKLRLQDVKVKAAVGSSSLDSPYQLSLQYHCSDANAYCCVPLRPPDTQPDKQNLKLQEVPLTKRPSPVKTWKKGFQENLLNLSLFNLKMNF